MIRFSSLYYNYFCSNVVDKQLIIMRRFEIVFLNPKFIPSGFLEIEQDETQCLQRFHEGDRQLLF